jgi:energy-coupling factor transporter ATP-binding protein EcfA2
MENGTAERPAADAPKKPKLTRLKIESFRNVEPCELRFGDGFNVLLGLNAAGKTTLLELIAAALSFDFSKFEDEAFAIEHDLSFSTWTVTTSMRNERVARPTSEASVLQVRDEERLGLSAKLQIRSTTSVKALTVCADKSSIWTEDEPNERYPLSRYLGERGTQLLSWAADLANNEAFRKAHDERLWHWGDAQRFDEALDMFRSVTGPATSIEARLNPSAGTVRWLSVAGLVPQELLEAVRLQMANMPADGQGLTISEESLGLLSRVRDLFGFKAARLEMRLESKTGTRSSPMLKFSDFRFMFEAHDGSVIRHEDLSYGQKRLLAFYYYLAASPMTVIADELVDGLHHLWIDAAISAIGDRQAFLASQNPLLLDHLEFDSAEQVASTFITCRTERVGDDKHMSWSNMSTYDAERFFRAYQVDVQQVSEILLSKGLW